MLRVGDVLSREVCTISPNQTLSHAASLMAEKQISCLVAINGRKPVGILTEADLVHIGRMNLNVRSTLVNDFLSKDLLSTTADKSLYEVYDTLLEHHVRHLVVLDDRGMLEGVITFSDLLKATEFDDYLKAKPVGEVMTRNIITVAPGETLLHALETMDEKHISCLVAVEDGKAVGVFSERDAARILASYDDLSTLAVRDVMSSRLVTVHESDSLLEASHLMREHHFRRMVVVDDAAAPVGILTQFDVVHGLEGKRIQQLKRQFTRTEAALSETRRLLSEKAELERRYRSLFDESRDMMHIFDAEGRIVDINQAELEMLGYRREELIGRPVSDIVCPKYREEARARFSQLVEGKPVGLTELALHTKSGECIDVEASATPQCEDGKVVAGRSVLRDIRERKAAEQRLQASQAIGHIGTWDWDPQSGELFWSDEAFRILGYEPGEAHPTYEWFLEHLHPEDRQGLEQAVESSLRGRHGYDLDYRIVRRDGAERFIHAQGEVEFDAEGRPARMLGILQDITERVQSEEQLRLSQFSLDRAPDAVYWMEPDGRFIYANDAASAMLGYSREELLDMGVRDVDPNLPEGIPAEMARSTREAGSNLIETTHRARDGRIIPVEVMVSCFVFSGREYHCSFVRDISARKAAEQRLKDSERRLQGILSASPVPTVVTRIDDGQVLFFNDESLRMFGMPDADFAQQFLAPDAYARPEDRAEIVDRLKSTGMFKGEIEMQRLDGKTFWALVSARVIEFDGEQAVLGLLIDTTEQRELEAQFRQAQKMESVGTLVGGIAHDFNNMLAGMLGQLYLVRHDLQDDAGDLKVDDAIERINAVEKQGQLAADVIAQLMTFARKGQVSMEPLDVNGLVADAMRLHRVSIPENIAVHAHLGDAMQIKGDAGLVQQMLLNLLTNARDALEGVADPAIHITLSRFVPDRSFRKKHHEFGKGVFACLEVRDNGCGIKPKQIDRIFDPFFTTKPVGKGTGLGLAMLYGAMQTHHGHVLVESTPGHGSCFRLFFPLIKEGGKAPGVAGDVLVPGKGQTILLADDEPMLIEVFAQSLERIGYQVFTAVNGEEAVRIFREHRDGIELVMLDVVMPVKGGVDAASEIRAMNPELPVIFHTGYGDKELLSVVQDWTHCETVKKPANIEQISTVIASLLEATAGHP